MEEKVVVSCPSCGQSYRVGPDKLGRSFKCAKCQQPFTAMAPVEPPAEPDEIGFAEPAVPPIVPVSSYRSPSQTVVDDAGLPTSKTAVASLVCGIPFCVFPLNVAALVLGIIGLRQTKPGMAKGRGMALAGTILGGVGLLSFVPLALMISILLPSLNRARMVANRAKSASNLHQIGLAVLLYNNDNFGANPPDLQTLCATENLPLGALVAPESNDTPATSPAQVLAGGHCSYVYSGVGLPANIQGTDIIAYEPLTLNQPPGGNFLFSDGHVEYVSGAAAQADVARAQSQPSSLPRNRRSRTIK